MVKYTGTPVGFDAIALRDGFWKSVQDSVRDVTIDAVYKQFKTTGRFDAMQCNWTEGMENQPHIYWDSDVAKWIEGAAYYLRTERNPAIEAIIDQYVAWTVDNQWADGYINSHYTTVEPDARFTKREDHELYCAGHIIEAAIAYFEATGKRDLLDASIRYADLIDDVFRKKGSASFDTPGHQEIELALVKLYNLTGDSKYKKLAEFFIEKRGCSKKDEPQVNKNIEFNQMHLPVRKQRSAVGHAVRLLYQTCAMADLARLNREDEMADACDDLFDDIVNRKMHITGGVGTTYVGERFTFDYDLPEYNTYNETCASIALAMFCQRMWLIDADRKYADCAEQALYNTVLSGISLSGDSFFYENPLAVNLAKSKYYQATEEVMRERMPIIERVRVFRCSCCPPNLIRTMGSISSYMYSTSEDTIFAHCYMNSDADIPLGEKRIVLHQQTDYPYSGKIVLTTETTGDYCIAMRIPGWCRQWRLLVNGKTVDVTERKGYEYISRSWQPGDRIDLDLGMDVQLIEANPKVGNLCGKCAVIRGPIVFCAEGTDNRDTPINDFCLALDTAFHCTFETICGRKLPVLRAEANIRVPFDNLYRSVQNNMQKKELTLIPYMAWANRGASDMAVWLNLR